MVRRACVLRTGTGPARPSRRGRGHPGVRAGRARHRLHCSRSTSSATRFRQTRLAHRRDAFRVTAPLSAWARARRPSPRVAARRPGRVRRRAPREVPAQVRDLVGALDRDERHALDRGEEAEVVPHADGEAAGADQRHHLLGRSVLVGKNRRPLRMPHVAMMSWLAALSNDSSSRISLQKKTIRAPDFSTSRSRSSAERLEEPRGALGDEALVRHVDADEQLVGARQQTLGRRLARRASASGQVRDSAVHARSAATVMRCRRRRRPRDARGRARCARSSAGPGGRARGR